MTLTIDPTDLLPGDVIIRVEDHDDSGCHCDVLLTVDRPVPVPPHRYHQLDGPGECDRCQALRDNQHWLRLA
jgi:hypothetical protein